MKNNKMFMYISQWAFKGGEPGLSLFSFDEDTGKIEKLAQLDDEKSFGCSVIDSEKNLMYLCNECNLFPETEHNTGRVYCYKLNPETGAATELCHRDTYSPFTSYLNLDPTGDYMVVSNHSWSTYITTVEKTAEGKIVPVSIPNDSLINLFAINEDGTIGQMLDYKKHQAPDSIRFTLEGRVTTPHPHSALRSPSGNLYAVCDKGDGHIYMYGIDKAKNELSLLSRTLTDTNDSEPRHCVFHPTLPYLFVNHEHTPGDRVTLTKFRYKEDGTLEMLGKVHADTNGFEPKENPRQQQGLCISPDGKYIYTQAHGYNLLIVFKVEEETGLLTQHQTIQLDGNWPRSVTMSPNGKFLINMCLGGQITVYAVGSDGKLSDTGHSGFVKGAGHASFYQP